MLNNHFLSNCRTGNELHEPKFSDDMEFIVEEKNIKKEVKEGQYRLRNLQILERL